MSLKKIHRKTPVPESQPATLLEKSLWHSCFSVNLAKFQRTSFLQNTSGRLLLGFVVFITIMIAIFFTLFSVENLINSF